MSLISKLIRTRGTIYYGGIVLAVLSFMIGSILSSHAQSVSIKKLELQENGDIIVYYDLLDEDIERKYSLYLYSSQDNYIQPLELVSGDIGPDLSVGGNKKITWKAKEELGADYKGGISLELKGSIYIPFITMDGFDDYKVFKRGKPYDITWTGGRGDNILNFELYDGDTKVKVFEERPNVGNTTIIIPKDVKPGKYRFKISDSRNLDEVVFTSNFQVKRRVPLVATLGTTVVVGGIVAILLNNVVSTEDTIGDPPKPSR